MEEGLLFKAKDQEEEGGNKSLTWDAFVEEAKKVAYIAGPMVAVTLSFQLISVISLMMVGHLGEVALASTAMATSLCAVTGPSLLVGMASGLETLCGQAYGAQQCQKLGVYTYSAMISLTLVCIPISFIWISMESILTFTGQDPVISREAGRYAICFIPALFGRAILHPLIKYLQTQSLIVPMLLSSMTTLCLHIPLCWVFVFHLGFGNIGAAFSCSISYWLNVLILGLYVKYSPSCKSTRVPLSKEAFQRIGEFLSLAVPSAVMVCLQWWSFEIMILLSGLLPNPQLETSVLSICLTSISLLYMIPSGIAAAVSTRVSNELGAGRPQAARLAVFTTMIIAGTEIAIVSSTLFVCRYTVGYAYSNAKEVVYNVTAMVPLICLSTILDGLQGVLSGIARGTGWQRIGAYVNLGSLYIGGIPVSLLLGFFINWRGRGLWLGIMSGAAIQTAILCVITIQTNWEKQAEIARKRIFQ
ncbi:protein DETOXIFICATION 14-like [Papaver somniferum]|uniref:protein DETOXIFICATION 14-like n=1 Tax=Papaver somniferum TaxID=3469 RepID=UPI000E705B7C|nr:protein DETOXIFICATION 14-like [Papaver somniferum]